MHKRLVLYFLFLLPCCPSILFAQHYVFRAFGQEAGLPVTGINHMLFDSRGFYWMATEGGGLVRWDGLKFKAYAPENGLPALYINYLEENEDHHLLVASTQGLFVYDGLTFETLLPDISVFCICKNLDGKWLLGTQQGLLNLSGTPVIADLPGAVRRCLTTPNGWWLGTDEGLFWWNGAHLSEVAKVGVKSLLDVDGTLWVGMQEGVMTVSGTPNYWLIVQKEIPNKDFKDIRGLAMDVFGNVWAGSYTKGLAGWRPDGQWFFYAGMDEGLPQGRVRALLADPFGRLWLSTLSGFTSLTDWRVQNYYPDLGAVTSLAHSIDGTTTFGTANGITRLHGTPLPASFPAGIVFEIREGPDASLWFATESGLLEFRGGKLINHVVKATMRTGFVFCVLPEGDAVYFGTTEGLFRMQNNRIRRMHPKIFEGRPVNTILRQGSDLIVNTIGGGVFRINPSGQVRRIRNSENWNVTTMAVKEERLYLGTNGTGLKVLEGGRLFHYGAQQGLRSGNVWAIAPGDGSSVWLGSERGIQCVIPAKDRLQSLHVFSMRSGLLDQEIARNALIWDSDNRQLFAGTGRGLAKLKLEDQPGNQMAPRVHITDIQLFFQDLDAQMTMQPFSGLPERGVFRYDQNYLTFSFAATSMMDQEKLTFRYMLRGQDQSWTYPKEKREAIFTNIRPGAYTLEVEAIAGTGISGRAQYSFLIQPAFWQTFWFWGAIAVVMVGLVFWVVRQRIRSLNERLKLESEKADLERKALRLQMNPHFIFNALDGITAFIFQNDPKRAVRYLSNFAKLMRLTLESSRESFIAIETEVNILKNYLELEQLRFSNEFDYEIIVADDVDPYDRIPPMMIQPHVENAVLHGLRPKGPGGKLTVAFAKADYGICCTITDNGIGREAAAAIKARSGVQHKSLAGEITENRVALMRKSYGKAFTFRIEDLIDPTGTRVTIQLPSDGGN
jgi:ligand-binding sensor domain-containing protein